MVLQYSSLSFTTIQISLQQSFLAYPKSWRRKICNSNYTNGNLFLVVRKYIYTIERNLSLHVQSYSLIKFFLACIPPSILKFLSLFLQFSSHSSLVPRGTLVLIHLKIVPRTYQWMDQQYLWSQQSEEENELAYNKIFPTWV